MTLGEHVPADDAAGGGVSILWGVPEDAAALAEVHRSAFAEPWDATAMAGMLAHPAAIAFKAWHARDGVVGFVLAHLAADEAEVLLIGVLPSHRRHGIGARLLTGLVRAAGAAGGRRLFLDVAESNTAAYALYAGAGFAEIGRRKGYYVHARGPREDAILLARDL